MTTKISTTNIQDTALTTLLGPKISSIVYPGTETATDTNGGETINLTGSGFQSGCNVLVASTSASVVTFISSTQISFTAPAQTAGTYVIYVINPDGGTAISIPGISYSGTPTWTTTAGTLGTVYETGSISTTLTATGDAPISYTLASGTLPTGSTLNSSTGLLSGTAPATASTTTYNFTITAKDAQNQTTNRAFSITLNPDVVTWSSPTNSQTYNVYTNQAIANVTMSATSAAGGSITYTADTLPTGLSITGANIAGTPTVVASTTTTLTATATSTRSATRTINWVVTVASDTYFKNTTLLLNGETTNTPFINDASTNSFGLTINGDTKPMLFNPYSQGYYSLYLNGSSYLYAPSSASINLSTGGVIEYWVYPTNPGVAYQTPFQSSTGYSAWEAYYEIYIDSSNPSKWRFDFGSGGITTSADNVTYNQWSHLCATYDGTTARYFINGKLTGYKTFSSPNSSSFQCIFGTYYYNGSPGTNMFTGNISNFRIIQGSSNIPSSYSTSTTTLGTQVFTPSTTPLTAVTGTVMLMFSSNTFSKDISTNNYGVGTISGTPTITPAIPFTANSSYSTYGSPYFDGTGDYLTAPNNSALQLSTSFTTECWVYCSGSTAATLGVIGYHYIVNGGTTEGGWVISTNASSQLVFGTYTSGNAADTTSLTSSYTVPLNTWVHVAVTISGTTATIYINGVSSATKTLGAISYGSAVFNVGRWNYASPRYFTGYIADVRVNNGSVVYTTTFTPPSTPLTAIANTQLLSLQYNGGANNYGIIDNSPFNNIITRSGNSTQGSFSPYSVTGWSNYFGGSDYLTVNSGLHFGTSDFTIECWIYPTVQFSTSVNSQIFSGEYNGSGLTWGVSFNSYKYPSGFNGLTFTYGIYGNYVTGRYVSGYWGTPGVWDHIVFQRRSGVLECYINGTSRTLSTYNEGTTWNDGATLTGNNTTKNIGNTFTGYICNLRVVTGTGLYSGTFTPSTTPLTPTSTSTITTTLLTCQSNRFVDNSASNLLITTSGSPTVQAYSQFGSIREATPTSYSTFFNGTSNSAGSSLSGTLSTSIGNSNFTLEGWVYHNTLYNYMDWFSITRGTTGFNVGADSTGTAVMYYNSARQIASSAGVIVTNQWQHFAFVRNGTTITLYINGTSVGSTTTITNSSFTATGFFIGSLDNTQEYMPGYISNLRLVIGTAVYTTNFTPSTTPLTAIANTTLLTCQSTTIIDNSGNNIGFTVTGSPKLYKFNPFGYTAQTYQSYTPSVHGGSVYFDGTGDYLTLPSSSSFVFGTSNFTIEFWFNASTQGTTRTVFIGTDTSFAANFWGIQLNNTSPSYVNKIQLWCYNMNSGAVTTVGSTTVINSTWNHVAVVRNGNAITIYLNGVADGTATSSASLDGGVSQTINIAKNSTDYFTGYISDLRITKSAVYTSNFVPPTQTLTNYSTTNPSNLLLNFTNAGIVDQHSSNVLEAVGNAQVSTAVKKYNNGSIYFDGSGDYLYSIPTVNYAMGSGDFTLELWYYPITHTNTDPSLMSNYNVTWTTNKWAFHAPHASYAGKYSFWVNNYATNSAILVSTSNVTDGSWVHIAITRTGSTWKMFINGTVEATTTSSVALDAGTAASMDGLYIGANFYTGAGGRYINAYIDDLRFTKGYARYTSNFTAPTSGLSTK